MVLSLFRPLLLRGTVFRTARAIPVRVAPIRALSLYSPLLKEAAATATATKEAKPRAKKTAVKKSKPKAKPGPKAKKPKKEEKPKKAVKEPLPDGISLPPKGPNTAYTLFFRQYYQENREKYMKGNGKHDAQGIAAECGRLWARLPEDEKAPLVKEAAVLKNDYKQRYAAWFNSLTAEQRREVEKFTGKHLHYPEGKHEWMKQIRDRPGYPGKPSSSFFEFLRVMRPKMKDDPSLEGLVGMQHSMALTKLLSGIWNSYSELEKQPWKEKFEELKSTYKNWAEAEGITDYQRPTPRRSAPKKKK